MKKSISITFFLVFLFISFVTTAQIRNVPVKVKATIKNKYPNAKDITYSDKITFFQAQFLDNTEPTTVNLSNSGKIKSTEILIKKADLPKEVIDGIKKSKYADWHISTVSKYQKPGEVMEYKIVVEGESIISRKNLYFSDSGQLLSDKMTL